MKTPPKCECGTCNTCYQRAWRAKNPDKVKAAKDKWGKSRDRSGDTYSLEYSRRYRQEKRGEELERTRARNLADPRKRIARNALNGALRYGTMTRQPCAVCGAPRTQGHHDDYDKPLDVIWLCTKHHADRHREMNDEGKTA